MYSIVGCGALSLPKNAASSTAFGSAVVITALRTGITMALSTALRLCVVNGTYPSLGFGSFTSQRAREDLLAAGGGGFRRGLIFVGPPTPVRFLEPRTTTET